MATHDEPFGGDADETAVISRAERREVYTAHRREESTRTSRLRLPVGLPVERTYEGAAATTAFVALILVVLEIVTDVLPDAPIFWVFTPVRVVILIGLAAAALSGLPAKRWLTPLDIPIVVLFLATSFATLIKGVGFAPIRGLLTSIAVYYLAVAVRRSDPASWHGWTALSFIGVATSSLIALDQFISRTPTGFCRASLDGTRDACSQSGAMVRSIGTFSNPNLLVAFLVLALPFALAWVLAQKGTTRTVGWVVIVAGYLAVLTTLSRGGIIAAIVGLGCFLLLRTPTRSRLLGVLGGIVVVVAGAVIAAVLGRAVGLRTDVWGAALWVASHNPLGVGLGRAGPSISAADPGDRVYQHAHNLWLNWLVEGGWLALLAVIAVTVMAAWFCLQAARRGAVAAVATGASLGGFAVLCLADHPANGARIAMLMWAVLALAATSWEPVERRPLAPGSRAARRAA